MAVSEPMKNDLTCPICLSLFVEPVRLDCEHNFCKSCIQKCWGKQRQAVCCPECQTVFLRRNYTSNRVLANLSESARQLELNLNPEEAQFHCEEHDEKLLLFCEEDETLVCASCVDSPAHSTHKFLSLQVAVQKYKDQLKLSLDSMEDEKKSKSELKEQQERRISELSELTASLEQDISAQFAKIHRYLEEKEKNLIEGLRRQKEEDLRPMEKNLKGIEQELASLEENILKLCVDIDQQDSISFLKELKRLRERYLDKGEEDEGAERGEDEEILVFPRMKYAGFRGPLLYAVWKEMKQIISPVPASLTLDPNTASCYLILSNDCTVRHSDTALQLPDSPERFGRVPCILGSQGFTSGKHYREVEVRNKTEWALGVARESINRKGTIKLGPNHGYWTVWLSNECVYAVTETRHILLTPRVNPRTIGVYLDYEGGEVTFYNADDMSILYTFTDTFTEKLFPFFYPGSYFKGKNAAPLKLRHFEL
ncbi:zinc-binding protein A33-like [Heterodontus francisci]|uniref:zinc-binding protein A33-like n=1 Tax=Heterodontus francisci TaxID=7792 RepID=UPI00355C5EE6